MYGIDAHPRRHNKRPVEKHGFFECASKAGFLVSQTGTCLAVLARAVHSVSPVQVLVRQAVLLSLATRSPPREEVFNGEGRGEKKKEEQCDGE